MRGKGYSQWCGSMTSSHDRLFLAWGIIFLLVYQLLLKMRWWAFQSDHVADYKRMIHHQELQNTGQFVRWVMRNYGQHLGFGCGPQCSGSPWTEGTQWQPPSLHALCPWITVWGQDHSLHTSTWKPGHILSLHVPAGELVTGPDQLKSGLDNRHLFSKLAG